MNNELIKVNKQGVQGRIQDMLFFDNAEINRRL